MEALGGLQVARRRGPAQPGLVLVYADNWFDLPPIWRLPRGVVTVGRDESVGICLPVKAVSRRHAEIRFHGGRYVLTDLESRNGTLIDGRLTRQITLEHAHELRIGDAVLLFVEDQVDAMGQYRIDGSLVVAGQVAHSPAAHSPLVGGYGASRIRDDIARVAQTPLGIIVRGESGTGKEVVARELHRLSKRSGAFCAVNCAALPTHLIESELFGYKRGAFSGADRDKPGIIRAAHRGTLLLDEIGDMPLEAQAKLLRVLQSREVFPLGANSPEPVDVRIVCATHRNLTELRRTGRFRDDLYARLNEFQLELPPLRERKEDIFALSRAFLARHGAPHAELSFAYMAALIQYDWPHNVRELEACIKRGIVLCCGAMLQEEHLPPEIREEMMNYGKSIVASDSQQGSSSAPKERDAPSQEQLSDLLTLHRGNVAAVGRELGKARMQVHRFLKRYGMDVDDFRR